METRTTEACTTDFDLLLTCIYSQSLFLHCFFPSQEPPYTFLERFSGDNKVISIEVISIDAVDEYLGDQVEGVYFEMVQFLLLVILKVQGLFDRPSYMYSSGLVQSLGQLY